MGEKMEQAIPTTAGCVQEDVEGHEQPGRKDDQVLPQARVHHQVSRVVDGKIHVSMAHQPDLEKGRAQ